MLKQVFCVTYSLSSHLEANLCLANPLEDDGFSCNVCRESPEGARELINLEKSFKQSNGQTVSCGELQDWVQDVKASGGAPGEARLCEITQYLAWLHCDCVGPEISSPIDVVVDLNPACNLCGDPGLDFNFVPQPNRNKLSDTGCCGQQNCEILYYGASQGTLTPNLCTIIQKNSGPDCCNLDILEPPLIDNDDEEKEDDKDDLDGEGGEIDDQEEESDGDDYDGEEGDGDEDSETNDQDAENEDNEGVDKNDEDDGSDCKDDVGFRFKGRARKDCEWLASRRFKKKKKICRRKSLGKRVWKLCPQACGKCLSSDNVHT